MNSCINITGPAELSSVNVSKVKNIQWNLISVETSSEISNLSDYEPFRIALLTNKIWGYDNCNYLTGNYSIINDSLIMTDGGITEMACPSLKFISFKHLFGKSKIMMRGTQLVLFKKDTNYVYYSNFTKDISEQNFLDDTLTLKSSNDINISFFDSLNLYPKLILNSDREFLIQWYNKSPENTGFINKISGIYGINENKDILFTRIISAYEGNGVSIYDRELVRKIVESKKFEFNNGILRLINNVTNTYYEFSK